MTPTTGPNSGVTPSSPTECETIGLVRSSVRSETDCKQGVRFYLEATGADWFNIHLGGLNNGPILGPNDPGEWSKWYGLKPGSYTYTAAAEARAADGSIIQCDHHNKDFTVLECGPCVEPPAPTCDFGPAVYNPEDCTWQCPPCVATSAPTCPLGPPVFNPNTCTWVCPTCTMPPPPSCPFGAPLPDPVACIWTCPPCVIPSPAPLCPYGAPVFDPATCSWSCPTCPVAGNPECPEQVWDPDLCKWVGECPCVPQECAFGYEWDPDQCKCAPMDLCHVSNKGKDGNWNIQESQKKFSPGHAKHLDPAKFCPPDYFGLCDNRYATDPHPCMR